VSKCTNLFFASALASAVVSALSVSTGNAAPGIDVNVRIKPLAAEREQAQFDRFIVRYRDDTTTARTQGAALSTFTTRAQQAGVAGVRMRDGTATPLTARYVRRMGIGADVIRVSRKLDRAEVDAILAQLRADPAVAYAEPDLMMHAVDFVPDDTHFKTLQWHYRNVSGTEPPDGPATSVGGINLPKAWGAAITNGGGAVPTPNGDGVVVAVLDTGYVDHADLSANIVPGYDFISAYGQDASNPNVAGDGDGRDADAHDSGDWIDSSMGWCGGPPSDSSWHGTHVAGTIAASTNNAKGVAGVAYNAKVMPVRVLGHCGGLTSDIADAITWASGGSVPGVPDNTNPAEVINMSLGGSGSCLAASVTQLAIDGALSRGATVVVAAGNNNADASTKTPSSCAGVITVGATGVDASRAFYSNYGLSVTLSAPGGGAIASSNALDASNVIWSTLNSGRTTPVATADGGDVYAGYVGTSMAAPHVSGVVALIQSTAVAAGQPALTPALVRQVLTKTARSFPSSVAPSVPMGVGIVDANAAVLMAKGTVTPDPATTLSNRVPRQITVASKNPVFNTTGGSSNLFVLNNVPAGKASLNIRTYGGTAASDVAIYVKRDSAPTTTDFDVKSDKAGTAETVMLTNPAAGNYYVLVVNAKASTDEYVLAAY